MKKKFKTALSEKCKDFGLTEKALDDLTELGIKGVKDDASDEDIAQAADLLVPYAKAIQGEITRKTRKQTTQSTEKQSKREGEGEGEKSGEEMPEWAKGFQAKLDALEKENATLKAEKTKTERAALIAEKAKKLGIPDYLMRRVSFADDADLDKELSEYKQELVTNSLLPKDAAGEQGSKDADMKAAAKSWAESLPALN